MIDQIINEESSKTVKEEHPTNINTELAKERTHTAYENNLMAWIRTALSLIGFGIGIFEVAEKTGGKSIFRSSKIIGLLLVIVGISAVLVAIQENKKNHEKLLHLDIKYERKTSLAMKVGYVLIFISVLALINIILQIIKMGI